MRKKLRIFHLWIVLFAITLVVLAFAADKGLYRIPVWLTVDPVLYESLFVELFSVQGTIAVLSVTIIDLISLSDKDIYLGRRMRDHFVKTRKPMLKTIVELALIFFMYFALALKSYNLCLSIFTITIGLTIWMFVDAFYLKVNTDQIKREINEISYSALFNGMNSLASVMELHTLINDVSRIIREKTYDSADDFMRFLAYLCGKLETIDFRHVEISILAKECYRFAEFYSFLSDTVCYELYGNLQKAGTDMGEFALNHTFWTQFYAEMKSTLHENEIKKLLENFIYALESGSPAACYDYFHTAKAILEDNMEYVSFFIEEISRDYKKISPGGLPFVLLVFAFLVQTEKIKLETAKEIFGKMQFRWDSTCKSVKEAFMRNPDIATIYFTERDTIEQLLTVPE